MGESARTGVQPFDYAVSVIIPTRNRPQRLAACLSALARQSFPQDRFELIVVDDGSLMSLEPVIAANRGAPRITLLRQANAGPAAARNAGAARATGALLAFTDDDCEPDREWLTALHARAAACPDALIGGHTINALPDNLCSTASQLLIDYLYEHHAGVTATDARHAPPFFTSNNFAVPAALFRRLEGFDASFPLAAGEDRELCDRWQHQGLSLTTAPEARVHHAHALSLRGFWRQHFNYGRGAWHLRTARLARGRSRIPIEPLTFYGRLVTYPLRVAAPLRALPLMGLLGLSQVANALGFAVERFRRRRS